ncbi:hypothetical protein LXL04_020315 [Taraxacum kok-saghyz]
MLEKLVAEREKEVQSQQASSSSSSNAITVNEREIFQKVFGKRRGHTVVIGRKLKRPSGLPSSSTTSANGKDNTRRSSSHTRSFRPTSQRAQIIPNVNVATFRPFESTPTPPFDYNVFMGSTNEVSQQQSDNNPRMMTRRNARMKTISL